MLSNKTCTATIPVVDLNRAIDFYRNKLGLNVSNMSMPGYAMCQCGNGTGFLLYQRMSPPKADHTLLTFLVDDVEAEVRELKQRGIAFEEYDLPGIKTVQSIATQNGSKSAWFKDTEGNILEISQLAPVDLRALQAAMAGSPITR